jgi:hypothetical protein
MTLFVSVKMSLDYSSRKEIRWKEEKDRDRKDKHTERKTYKKTVAYRIGPRGDRRLRRRELDNFLLGKSSTGID